MERFITQLSFTPILGCDHSECSMTKCTNRADYTICHWVESHHGPEDESCTTLHGCAEHLMMLLGVIAIKEAEVLFKLYEEYYNEAPKNCWPDGR